MKRLILSAVLVPSSLALAQGAPPPPAEAAPPPPSSPAAPPPAAAAPPAPAVDWTKVGPAARKPKNEAATRKEIAAFLAEEEKLYAAKNWDGLLSRIDFPVTMITDDSAGKVSSRAATKEQYVAEMKPFWESMPANTKVKHRPTITVYSDSLASVVDDFQMTMGKNKVSGRNTMTLVKVDGAWKTKVMVEAGWGDMAAGKSLSAPAPAPTANSAPAPAPAAPAPAPAKPAPAVPAPAPAKTPPAPPPTK